ncbi:SURF1 family protein [Kineococcus sp. T13]|uniref:SURF1 family cytochrome oxidase biogenesis protein n=1 Tax=Kineococcus vitellinus TaxID=2696565 RepID=UPI001412FAC3|nr:SURF1 family protein [Kineococcus vitellinus]NAZ77073.1 SURF1 family protein [Kineococcus vitellinus]
MTDPSTGERVPGSVLGLLREPRWVRGLALALAVAVVCCVLGRWQWHRRQDRLAANAPLTQNYDAPPGAVTDVLPAGEQLDAADAWTPVRVEGTYDAGATVLVRNRPRDEQTGYDVLVPLVLADGGALLVDRGWVPAGSSSERPDSVPAPPQGPVSVVARLRPWEPTKRGEVPAGQAASIAAEEVGRQTAAAGAPPLLGGYAVLAAETPAPAQAPLPAERPDVDEGPHLAYTVQWFGFAVTALVVWVVAGRRELEARRSGGALGAPLGAGAPPVPGEQGADAREPDGREPDGREPDGPTAGGREPAAPGERTGERTGGRAARRGRARGRGAPPRPGSDEEAEDAALDGRHGASSAR